MNPTALKSRLGAVCSNIYAPDFEWSMEESNAVLARKIIDTSPKAWENFSNKYDMVFDYKRGKFYDIAEMAHTLVVAEASEDPKIRAQAAKINELLEKAAAASSASP